MLRVALSISVPLLLIAAGILALGTTAAASSNVGNPILIYLSAEAPNVTPKDLAIARDILEERLRDPELYLEDGLDAGRSGSSSSLRELLEAIADGTAPGLEPFATVEVDSEQNRLVIRIPVDVPQNRLDRILRVITRRGGFTLQLVKASAQDSAHGLLTHDDLEEAAFTGEIIDNAWADFSPPGFGYLGPLVLFDVKPEYASAFGDFTQRNIGRRLAIVLDGVIYSAPVLQARISDAGQITGIPTIEEASDIAFLLRVGRSLPIPLRVENVTKE